MLSKELRENLIALAAIAVIVWGAVFAAYCGKAPLLPHSPNGETTAQSSECPEGICLPVSVEKTADDRIADYTYALALLTGVLALSTIGLWIATWRAGARMESTVQTAERAYVKMSHTSPGVSFQEEPDIVFCSIEFRVMNLGRTPATVTDFLLRARAMDAGALLPEEPDYTGSRDSYEMLVNRGPPHFYVAANDDFLRTDGFQMPPSDLLAIRLKDKRLLALGYVEYRDEFSKCHRARYARWYDPDTDDWGMGEAGPDPSRNNLTIVAQRRYNDDIEIDCG